MDFSCTFFTLVKGNPLDRFVKQPMKFGSMLGNVLYSAKSGQLCVPTKSRVIVSSAIIICRNVAQVKRKPYVVQFRHVSVD